MSPNDPGRITACPHVLTLKTLWHSPDNRSSVNRDNMNQNSDFAAAKPITNELYTPAQPGTHRKRKGTRIGPFDTKRERDEAMETERLKSDRMG